MTAVDPIITAARDHANARRDVLADLAASLPPAQLVSALLDLAVLAREDLERLVTDREEARRERNAAWAEIDQIAAAAGVDGAPGDVTGRIVKAIAGLRAEVDALKALVPTVTPTSADAADPKPPRYKVVDADDIPPATAALWFFARSSADVAAGDLNAGRGTTWKSRRPQPRPKDSVNYAVIDTRPEEG